MFLTALGAVHDKLSGFSAGADDYLPKPFDPLELVARVEVLARRGPSAPSTDRTELALDPARHSMTCNGREVMLTPTEFRMLAAITSRPGEVVRRRVIAAAAWPSGGYVSDNSIDSYVRRIRKKLRDVEAPQELSTVRGVGYTLR
jgi:DNA-binding response OmpR family regulator